METNEPKNDRTRTQSPLVADALSRRVLVMVGASEYAAMVTSEWCGGMSTYRPGDIVYCQSEPLVPRRVMHAALGVSVGSMRVAPIYQVRAGTGSSPTWVAEVALSTVRVRLVRTSAASEPDTADGSICVSAGGGCRPYKYRLAAVNPGGAGVTPIRYANAKPAERRVAFTGLVPGVYRVSVLDAHGVPAHGDFVMRAASALPGPADWTPDKCVSCGDRRDAAFQPCGCVVMCMTCSINTSIASAVPGAPFGICPYCRRMVEHITPVRIP
jgi:hypothetical protein